MLDKDFAQPGNPKVVHKNGLYKALVNYLLQLIKSVQGALLSEILIVS